jgi:hypothetical protein
MITKNRIVAIVKQAKAEGIEGDIKSVLEQSMTAGMLIKALQKFNPETPVELEIPVEIDKESDEMFSEVGFLIDLFESEGETADASVITLRACKPELLQDYKNWSSDEGN